MYFLKYLLCLPMSVTLLKIDLTLSLLYACSDFHVKKRLALGPQAKHWTSLYLCFLICQMSIIPRCSWEKAFIYQFSDFHTGVAELTTNIALYARLPAPQFKSSMVRKALVVNKLVSEELHTQFAVSNLALSHQQQQKLHAYPYGAHGVLSKIQPASLKQISIYRSKLQDCNSAVKFPLQDKNCCEVVCLKAFSFLVYSRKPKDVKH